MQTEFECVERETREQAGCDEKFFFCGALRGKYRVITSALTSDVRLPGAGIAFRATSETHPTGADR